VARYGTGADIDAIEILHRSNFLSVLPLPSGSMGIANGASPRFKMSATTYARALPYLLSWGVLAFLMVVGMNRLPLDLYTPVDGEWAKWNVEAILKFSKPFDLSPYSMLAGMGSMYFPNLPWLNPGALALALPIEENAKNIVSYVIYAAELAFSIVLLARAIGFSWLNATVGAQLYLYVLFPPFSWVFLTYNWYSLAPYYAHLAAVLNAAMAVILLCGRGGDWRYNLSLVAGFFALFISALLSAPFTLIFAMPAYVVICAALIVARHPSRVEWAWKVAPLALCLIFFFASDLLDYYLGTIATVGRTPAGAVAWDKLLSIDAWLHLFRDHSLCARGRLLLCINDRGAWLLIAAIAGAAIAIVTRRGDIRAAAWGLIAYLAFAHVYAYASQVGWLGPASVLSSAFLMLSSWSFICIFAASIFFEPFRLIQVYAPANAKARGARQWASLLAGTGIAVLLVVIIVEMLAHPYGDRRYGAVQLAAGGAAFGGVLLVIELMRLYWNKRIQSRALLVLSIFPILAVIHLSLGIRHNALTPHNAALRDYLRENASIALGEPFRGYAATIWIDENGRYSTGPNDAALQDSRRYLYGRAYFRARYGDSFTEVDLWRWNIPTFEEYGEWTSVQAHAFVARLLMPAGFRIHSNYLRVFTIDSVILRAVGVRYILTDAEALDEPAILRGSVEAPDAPTVRLFELIDPNLGTYSPTHFIKATTADEIVQRIRENKDRLDQVAVVTDDLPSTTARARDVVMTVEPDGVRIQASSNGPAHLLLPLQFSHCLVVVNGATARLSRANLFQTLLSFDRAVDARIEFRFGLFADNACRLRDGLDNKALGL
jgi:hypothetical protein